MVYLLISIVQVHCTLIFFIMVLIREMRTALLFCSLWSSGCYDVSNKCPKAETFCDHQREVRKTSIHVSVSL